MPNFCSQGDRLPKRLMMKLGTDLRSAFAAVGLFAAAGTVSLLTAWGAATVIEARSQQAVTSALLSQGITWVTVSTDGLQVRLSGQAPDEAARFRAVNLAGTVVRSGRIRDLVDVAPVSAIEAPRFSIEMLRNDDGIQLIGLLPSETEVEKLRNAAISLIGQDGVSDMLETADFPPPAEWAAAYDFGLTALQSLTRSKISVAVDGITVNAIADSDTEQRRLESELAREKPEGVPIAIDISAPRPVLTPFTLRFVKDGQGARFDACSADTDDARRKILSAGASAGTLGKVSCTLGLGVPSPRWAEAVRQSIDAVAKLGDATVTFSDADISLVAAPTVSQSDFDQVVGELQSALPAVFSLDAKLERKADQSAGPAEFLATLGDKGRIEIRGRLTDERLRSAVDSYAKARFGADKVYVATRLDETLPDGWPVRVLAGLESLALLETGSLIVRPDSVEVAGLTGSQDAPARVSQILSDKLGQGQTFRVKVTYDEALDPLAALPTPEECVEKIAAVVAKSKIVFPPGSAEIDGSAAPIMDALAQALENCGALQLEISGHTDSQGSDGGNRALSQARAEAVLLALQGRGVDVSAMTAKGYGEDHPIADNGTEEGREANRRIEFVRPSADPAPAVPPLAEAAPVAEAAPASADAPPPAEPAPAEDADPVATEPPQDDTAAPDFTGDDSPSVAPTEATKRPRQRPARDG